MKLDLVIAHQGQCPHQVSLNLANPDFQGVTRFLSQGLLNFIKNWIFGYYNSRVFIGLAIMVYEPLYHDLQLVRQSQIVQSVMQDCQYDLSHLLPVCNLLVILMPLTRKCFE